MICMIIVPYISQDINTPPPHLIIMEASSNLHDTFPCGYKNILIAWSISGI